MHVRIPVAVTGVLCNWAQGLFRLCLKTFVAPSNPARLTAPGSPRMGWWERTLGTRLSRSRREKRILRFWEPTLQKIYLKKSLTTSSHTWVSEDIQLYNLVNKVLAEVKFTDRKSALRQNRKEKGTKLTPFVTQYKPSVPSLKKVLINRQVQEPIKWSLHLH